jgi:predicted nucleotidyltransferase
VLSLFNNKEEIAMANPIMILKELKRDLVSNFGDDINDVILFGSQASGKAVEDSDYDILILLSNDYDWRYQNLLFDKAFDVGLKYQVLFDLHLLSSNERDHSLKGKEPIIIHALEKGIYA